MLINQPCFYFVVFAVLHVATSMAVLIAIPGSCWELSLAYLLGISCLALVGFSGLTYKLRHEEFWRTLRKDQFKEYRSDWSFRLFWSISVKILTPAQFSAIFISLSSPKCEERTPAWISIMTLTSCFLTWPWGIFQAYYCLKECKNPFIELEKHNEKLQAKQLLAASLRSPDSLKIFKENYQKVEWPMDFTSHLIVQYIAKHASYRVPEEPPKEIDDSFSWDQSQDCIYSDEMDVKLMTWNFFHKHSKRCCKICKRLLRRGEIAVDLECCRHPFSVDRFHLDCLEKCAASSPNIFCYWNEKPMNITELFAKLATR